MDKQIGGDAGTYFFKYDAPDGCITGSTSFSATNNWVSAELVGNNTLKLSVTENTGSTSRYAEILPCMGGIYCYDKRIALTQVAKNAPCDCNSAYIYIRDFSWLFDDVDTRSFSMYLLPCHSVTVTSNKSNSHFGFSVNSDSISFTPKEKNMTSSNIVETITITLKVNGTTCTDKTQTITLTHYKSNLNPKVCYKDIKVTDITYVDKESGCTVTWTYTEVYTDEYEVTTETSGSSSHTVAYEEIWQTYQTAMSPKTMGFYWENHKDCTTQRPCFIEFANNVEFDIHTYSCDLGVSASKTGSTDFKIACLGRASASDYFLFFDEPTSWISNIHRKTLFSQEIVADIAPNDTGDSRTCHADLIAYYTNGDQKRIAVIIDIGTSQSG